MHIHFEHTTPLPIVANIVCPNSLEQVTIPHNANISLRLDCEIQSTSFRIWPMKHLLTPKTVLIPTHEITSLHDSSIYGIVRSATSTLHNITRDVKRMRSFLFQEDETSDIAAISSGVDATNLIESTVASLASLNGKQLLDLATQTATSTWSIWVPCILLFLIIATVIYFYVQYRLKNLTLLRKLYRRIRGTPATPSVEMAVVSNHTALRQQVRQLRLDPGNPPPYAPSAPQAPRLRSSMAARSGILSKAEFDSYKAEVDLKIADLQHVTRQIPTLITKTAHL